MNQVCRIAILGSSGAGKTTLALALSKKWNIPHLELDSMYWQENWTPLDTPEFLNQVDSATSTGNWVVDGNYSPVRSLVLARATTIVWLDLPLSVVLRRLLRRTFSRAWNPQPLWNNNRENLRTVLFSKDSLFLWTLKTFSARKKEYNSYFLQEHLAPKMVHLRDEREVEEWLKEGQR